jgi:type II restriction/modification system DNA methylase subunit YeeA
VDVSELRRLAENANCAFRCPEKNGSFEVEGILARHWIECGFNPNERPNSDVLFRWMNGTDVVGRDRDFWIVDFGTDRGETDACLYELPFEHVRREVKPLRERNRRGHRAERWWLHGELARNFRLSVGDLSRYIVTPRVAKHRLFVWMHSGVLPDSRLFAIARDDDATFGILHSRFHEAWSLATCSWHGDGDEGGRPTYNAQAVFETFPFPEGLTPNIPASAYTEDPRAQRIAAAARRLDELRNNWLNPADLVRRGPEVVPGFPDRILPINSAAAEKLKKRTLTNLYNERPAWLVAAHKDLDNAVAAAYGWPADLSDDEVLAKLLELNLARAAGNSS